MGEAHQILLKSNKKSLTQPTVRTPQTPKSKNWFEYISDDNLRLAIPVGPRFQADVPEWNDTSYIKCPSDRDGDGIKSDTSRWLGTHVWPLKNRSLESKGDFPGRGRPCFCSCVSPGSIECVNQHVSDKRIQLQYELGPAFWRWKFDNMGEEVSKLWNVDEQKKFEFLVKTNPVSKGKNFMKPALDSLPSQNKESIVSYYFNVYIPREISIKTRSSNYAVIDTDDEAEETPNPKSSRKRCLADGVPSCTFKYVKTRYLIGRR